MISKFRCYCNGKDFQFILGVMNVESLRLTPNLQLRLDHLEDLDY